MRALKGFVFTPKAEAMRRWFAHAKGSVERGGKVLRQEIRARKADRDSQGMPPVPGKDISPYDGRPASWWRESAGKDGGRRAERERVRAEGGGQVGLGQGLEGDCGSGGAVAGGGSNAAVEVGCDIQADGTRSVPATSNEKGRGWDSVVVEESDILACGGYLPEKYIGGDGEVEIAAGGTDEVSNPETGSLDLEQAGPCEIGMNAGGASPVEPDEPGEVDSGERTEEVGDEAGHGSTPVVGERPPTPLEAAPHLPRGRNARQRKRRTNPIRVMTGARYNINILLKLRRIPAVFWDLTVVKRTQFFWKRSQFRRGGRKRVEAEVRRGAEGATADRK